MKQQQVHFQPSYFFNLSNYKHAQLFEGIDFVWEALQKMDSYLEAYKLGVIEIDIPVGAHLVNPHLISIGKGSVVEPGAYIKGPCIIGEGCTIRHGAYIRGDVIVGDRCVVGHDTEMKSSIMLDDAHAAHFAYLGNSILGNKVNLGAGTKCANLKLDGTDIVIRYYATSTSTKMRKLGAIIGDHTQIGCNAVTNPGTLLGQYVQCYPCLNVGGVVPSKSRVKTEAKIIVSPIK